MSGASGGANEPSEGAYKVSLPSFEGPLDLLLHLCQKHELDILDIPIAFVTEKYLEYISVMRLVSLDIASEYLVMAATLAHIKSKMLLPAPPPGQEDDAHVEEEDPREALIRRLLEYQKYKLAGEELAGRGVAGRDIFLRGAAVAEAVHTGLPPLAQVQIYSLVEAFQGVLSRSKVKLTHEIVHERMSLTDRINELVDVLRVRRRVVFEDLFDGLSSPFNLVITFLALLEMTRLRMTRLTQTEPMAPIYVEFSASEASDGEDYGTPQAPPADADATADATADADADANASPTEPPTAAATEFPPAGASEPPIEGAPPEVDETQSLDTDPPPDAPPDEASPTDAPPAEPLDALAEPPPAEPLDALAEPPADALAEPPLDALAEPPTDEAPADAPAEPPADEGAEARVLDDASAPNADSLADEGPSPEDTSQVSENDER